MISEAEKVSKEPGPVHMTLYDKDEVADLSPDEKRLLKAAIEQETRQRAQRRGTRRE